MRISTKGRYALRVMIDLAQHSKDEYVKLQELAERQQISEKYLEGILGKKRISRRICRIIKRRMLERRC